MTPGSANAVKFDTANKLDITCTGDATGANVKCDGPNGLTKTVPIGMVGQCAATDDFCVFAGSRSDPFFFDFLAFQQLKKTNDAGAFCVNDAGSNAIFDKKNVMSIIVEVNALKLTGKDSASAFPILGVAASTNRVGN